MISDKAVPRLTSTSSHLVEGGAEQWGIRATKEGHAEAPTGQKRNRIGKIARLDNQVETNRRIEGSGVLASWWWLVAMAPA